MAKSTYDISPIDVGWDNLKTVWETAALLGAKDAESRARRETTSDCSYDLPKFLTAWEFAKQKAGDHGWEGDFRIDPVVFWVPDDTQFSYGFVFKQDNNGTTYIVSPVDMPHLKDLEC